MAKDEEGKVFFDADEQKEVDRVVQERLARAKPPDDYTDLKEISDALEAIGFTGTPAEKKAAVRAIAEENSRRREAAELQAAAAANGTDPETERIKKEVDALKAEREAEKEAEKQKADANAAWEKQIRDFEEAYPDVNLDDLDQDPKFIKFARGKNQPLKEIYADYVEIVGDVEKKTIDRVKSKEARSTGGAAGKAETDRTLLTAEERRTLDEFNRRYPQMAMTPKEYKERKNK